MGGYFGQFPLIFDEFQDSYILAKVGGQILKTNPKVEESRIQVSMQVLVTKSLFAFFSH